MVRKALTGVTSPWFRGSTRSRRRPGLEKTRAMERSVALHLHAHYRAMLLDPKAAGDEVAAVHAPSDSSKDSPLFTPDSGQAWVRLALALVIGSIGSVGMWSVVVVLPVVQAEFGATPRRGVAGLYADHARLRSRRRRHRQDHRSLRHRGGDGAQHRRSSGSAYVVAGLSTTLWQFILVHFLIGLGTSATFGPLMAEASHWFERYRGLAVTIVASGNYVGGTIWPPLVNWGTQTSGWRTTHIAIGIFCAVAMTLVLLLLRAQIGGATPAKSRERAAAAGRSAAPTNTLTAMLCIASISCCVAMAMPQVHIVAYCGDLGYGVARGAEMLSLMMAFGIISRIGSGFLADRIGGIRTLLIGSVAQGFCAVVLSVLRQPHLALHHLRDVRPVPGRHRAELRHHRPRIDAGERSRDPRRHRDFCLRVRHVVRRLGVRRDLRRHRLLRRGVPERAGLECAQHHHHGGAADPGAVGASLLPDG